MTQSATDQLAELTKIVEQAKAVPMSASCLLNRSEVLERLGRLTATVTEELAAARRESGIEEVEDAHVEAGRILAEARARAAELASVDAVKAEVDQQAEASREESEALKREADAYVDSRMAELEAAMLRTLSQIQTMRARLSERSQLDD